MSKKLIVVMMGIVLALGCVGLTACSSGSGGEGGKGSAKNTGGANTSVNGYSVDEYNADVDNLSRILNEAKSLNHQIEAMGNPDAFSEQWQVDQYNGLVDQYNACAQSYRDAVTAFNKKYATSAEGASGRETDPDNITLPQKK